MINASYPDLHENISYCYQCSKCSVGCPVVEEMDVLPHQIIHSLAIGLEAEVLHSDTIWICAGCYTCAVRCPNDINITSVMDDLRKKAIKKDLPCPKPEILKFHQAFLNDMQRRGRVHELRFMGEYNLKLRKPLNNIEVAPKMLLKGRLKLRPPKTIKDFKTWSKRLWNRKN